jgi:hypothetical protein
VRAATLSWTLPPITDLGQVIVRMAAGNTAPSGPTAGTAVYAGTGSTATASGLAAGGNGRVEIERYVRWLQEVRGYQPSTVSRRLSVVVGFYRVCVNTCTSASSKTNTTRGLSGTSTSSRCWRHDNQRRLGHHDGARTRRCRRSRRRPRTSAGPTPAIIGGSRLRRCGRSPALV